jgi:hypothetical protein
MKRIFICSVLAFAATVSALAQKTKKDTTVFKLQNNKAIEIGTLSDGNHSFLSVNGAKLVLTIKNHQVAGHQYFSPKGTPIITARNKGSIADALRVCTVCTTVHYPNGTTQKLCDIVDCPSAQSIQNSLQ